MLYEEIHRVPEESTEDYVDRRRAESGELPARHPQEDVHRQKTAQVGVAGVGVVEMISHLKLVNVTPPLPFDYLRPRRGQMTMIFNSKPILKPLKDLLLLT